MNCYYGCENTAQFYFKSVDRWCCSKFVQQCPEFKKKLINAKIGKKRSSKSVQKQKDSMRGRIVKPYYTRIFTEELCYYKCGKKGKFVFKNGNICCSKNYRSCSGFIKSKNRTRVVPSGKFIKNSEKFCSYGCGNKGIFKFKNGNYCCSNYTKLCPATKRKVSKKTKEKLRKINLKPLKYWTEKYPLFFKIEKIRINPSGRMLVSCKKCKKWFIPTYIQIYERIRNIEREDGGGDYFYCSDKCKGDCSVYGKNPLSFIKSETEDYYTNNEHQTFRQFVLERDNYKCQFCGEKATDVHHERPQKLEPFFSLDPDFAWSCCEKCHYEKGHPTSTECSTGNLANRIC